MTDLPNYGPHAGDGLRYAHLPPWGVCNVGVKQGRLKELDAFLRGEADRYSAWLLTFDPVGDRKGFNAALTEWVRERHGKGLNIPDCIHWQCKPE